MSGHNGASGLAGLPTDELRAAVRAVLRDVLPAAVAATPHTEDSEEVTLGDSADLDSFVRRIAALCEDPAQRGDLQDGRRRFRLTGPGSPTAHASPARTEGVVRVDRGAVTERTCLLYTSPSPRDS